MFASRAIATSHTGHRCASSAKFTTIRRVSHDHQPIPDVEDEAHPNRSLACAVVSAVFCPILGIFALFYAIRTIRAYRQGYYAEAITFKKQAIRWSLITFIAGLIIGSLGGLAYFVKTVRFI